MIVILTAILAFAAGAAQSPSPGANSDRYTVEALDIGGGGRAARVIISNNVTSRRHMLSINSTLGELRRAIIRQDEGRVLLLCEHGFAVVDPAGQVPADEVYGSDATASPDGRWIAFRRFLPSTHPGPSDAVAVYDTRRTPEQNHAAHPIAPEREWRAGWPVFPPAAEWTDASTVTLRESAYTLSSALTWEGRRDQPALLFSMRHAGEEIVVIAAPGDGAPRVCWSVLPGPAERWRVKSLDLSDAASGGRTVRAKSSAVDNAAATTIEFGATCSGRNP